MDTEAFEDLLAEVVALCLDRMEDGDSAEQCAADFPEFPDLLPMLQIAAELRSQSGPEPRPEWLKASRARIESRLRDQSRN